MADPFLAVHERQRVIALVGGLYDFTDQGARGRRAFLQGSAGLGRFSPYIDLAGPPRTVAADLVDRLERFGLLPERPVYHALGALLSALVDLDEMGTEDRTFAATLIIRHRLVGDPSYLHSLQERFAVGERAPLATPLPVAASARMPMSGPPFDPVIPDESGLETIIHSADNFLDIELLTGALYSAYAVGRIELPERTPLGTGFLIGPDLVLTNQHVLKAQDYLEDAVMRFGYQKDPAGVTPDGRVLRFDIGFYHASPAVELDYALVRLREAPLAGMVPDSALGFGTIQQLVSVGKHRGYLTLTPRTVVEGARVNIVQHPEEEPMKVVLTQNYVVHRTDTRLQYVADTMAGSSGSPVFNAKWEVVALHHSGKPHPPDDLGPLAKKAWKGRFRVNEGIPIRALLEDLRAKGLEKHLPRS